MKPDLRQFAPATERNRDYILPILQRLITPGASVLEIGSGTGEHAVYFARTLEQVRWHPTEMNPHGLASIAAWIEHAKASNISPPQLLDVMQPSWPVTQADAIVCINMIHYSPWEATPALFAGAARTLSQGGVLYCYGPYRRHGGHTAPSNEDFDAWLKDRDPRFGVRDVEAVEREADGHGLRLEELIPMPANNFSLVFRRA